MFNLSHISCISLCVWCLYISILFRACMPSCAVLLHLSEGRALPWFSTSRFQSNAVSFECAYCRKVAVNALVDMFSLLLHLSACLGVTDKAQSLTGLTHYSAICLVIFGKLWSCCRRNLS
ncbi:hypothetical protein EDB87DRAFT_1588658 [Lactarius vividus]|nr:hypothetical protein EDB87DRAFT_1588658 [Lactarius vividus]